MCEGIIEVLCHVLGAAGFVQVSKPHRASLYIAATQEYPIEIALEKMIISEFGDFGEAPWILKVRCREFLGSKQKQQVACSRKAWQITRSVWFCGMHGDATC